MATQFLQQVQSVMENYSRKSQTMCDPTLSETSCDLWITEVERLVVTRLPQVTEISNWNSGKRITETGWADDYMLVCYYYPHIDGPPTVVPVADEPKCSALLLSSDVGEEALLEAVWHIIDIPRDTNVA